MEPSPKTRSHHEMTVSRGEEVGGRAKNSFKGRNKVLVLARNTFEQGIGCCYLNAFKIYAYGFFPRFLDEAPKIRQFCGSLKEELAGIRGEGKGEPEAKRSQF